MASRLLGCYENELQPENKSLIVNTFLHVGGIVEDSKRV